MVLTVIVAMKSEHDSLLSRTCHIVRFDCGSNSSNGVGTRQPSLPHISHSAVQCDCGSNSSNGVGTRQPSLPLIAWCSVVVVVVIIEVQVAVCYCY